MRRHLAQAVASVVVGVPALVVVVVEVQRLAEFRRDDLED